jgi:hypothetical protein
MGGLILNRVRATVSDTGTGAVTPGSGIPPHRSWSSAGAVSGRSYSYLIEDGYDWELGTGVYNGTTITRPGPGTDPTFASSTGALLSLSGASSISSVAKAADYHVAPLTQLVKTSAQSITSGTWTTVSWDTTPVVDDVGAFSSGAPTLLTVPTGWSRVRVSVHTIWENGATGLLRYMQCVGSRTFMGSANHLVSIAQQANEAGAYAISPWITNCVAGDTFSVQVNHNKGSASNFSPAAGFSQAWIQAEWAR